MSDPLREAQYERENRDARLEAIARLRRDTSQDAVWPWRTVTDAVGSLTPGTLTVIGANAGGGKTMLLLGVARWLRDARVPWTYAGLELAPAIMVQLLAALERDLPRYRVIEGTLTDAEQDALEGAVLSGASLTEYGHFLPAPQLTPATLCAEVVRLQKEMPHGLRVVIVDHLHELDYSGYAGIREGVGDAARSLKALARSLDVVVLCAAQLRRPVADRPQPWRVPGLHELRETGAIEQVADIVMMLHRLARADAREQVRAYLRGSDPSLRVEDLYAHDRMGVTLVKHRFGRALGTTVLRSHPPTDRLTDMTEHEHVIAPRGSGDAWESQDDHAPF